MATIVAGSTPSLASAGAVRWASFTPPEGQISIAVPGEPIIERRATPTIVGTVHTRIWHSTLDTREYWIAHTVLPPIAAFFSSRDMVYDKSRDNLMKELGAEPLRFEERDGELLERVLYYRIPARDGKPAREGRVGMRLIGDTLVSVSASAPDGEAYGLEGFFRYVRGVPGSLACEESC